MATIAGIVARAETIANGRRTDGFQSPIIDSDMTAEQLFPHAVRYVIASQAKSGSALPELSSPHTIAITGGVGTLPDDVVFEALDSLYVLGRKYVAIIPYADYQRKRFDRLVDYIAFSKDANDVMKLYYTQGGVSNLNTSITISAVTLPEIPSDPTVQISMSDDTLDEVVLVIAGSLTGEFPLAMLLKTSFEKDE